jgi:2-phosphoglycerate kinase
LAGSPGEVDSQLPKVLLIGGVSHVGKSTLARRLADELNWQYLSTDQLARHPGRPWRSDGSSLPVDVLAHYSQLSTQRLTQSVLAHYQQNVWPIVEAIVLSHVNNPYDPNLVFEGSAILPELVSTAALERVSFVWLGASHAFIKARILETSDFSNRTTNEQHLIQAFLDRTLALSDITQSAVRAAGLPVIDVEEPGAYQELRSRLPAPVIERF